MKFKTIAEAFNHYRTSTLEEIECRAAEIKNIVATDATADVDALNIELEGLSQAKQNVQSRAAGGQQNSFNPVAGAGRRRIQQRRIPQRVYETPAGAQAEQL